MADFYLPGYYRGTLGYEISNIVRTNSSAKITATFNVKFTNRNSSQKFPYKVRIDIPEATWDDGDDIIYSSTLGRYCDVISNITTLNTQYSSTATFSIPCEAWDSTSVTYELKIDEVHDTIQNLYDDSKTTACDSCDGVVKYYGNGSTTPGTGGESVSSVGLSSHVSPFLSSETARNLADVTVLFTPPTGYSLYSGAQAWHVGGRTSTTYFSQVSQNMSGYSGTVLVYANWAANTYYVKFDSNGGSGSMTEEKFTYGESGALSTNAFTRAGYTFSGWSQSSTATTATYTNGQSVKNLTSEPDAVITLYAVWAPITYTVSYYDEGSVKGSSAHTYGVSKNLASASSLNISHSGWYFYGWATASNTSVKKYDDTSSVLNLTTTSGGTVKLYALWEKDIYFYSDSSTLYDDSYFQTLYYSGTTAKYTSITLPNISKTGKTFLGWYTAASGGTKVGGAGDTYTPASTITAYRISLYAQWSVATYTISYKSGSSTTGTIPSSQTKTYDIDLTLRKNDGTGSVSSGTYEGDLSKTTTETGATLTYDANGGSYSGSSMTNEKTTTYPFNGWSSTSQSATSGSTTYSTNADATFYPAFKSTGEVTYSNLTLPNSSTTTRKGYVLLGWDFSASVEEPQFTPGQVVTPTINHTMHAIWKKSSSVVKIYNGSTWVDAVPYIYTGSAWTQATAYIYNGSTWQQTTS